MTKVKVTMIGEQKQPNGDTDRTVTTCTAAYHCKHEGTARELHELTFIETPEEAVDGFAPDEAVDARLFQEAENDGRTIYNCIQISKDRIAVSKTGMIVSTMLIETGRENACLYATPYGAIPMCITGNHVRILTTARAIHARAVYQICMEEDYRMESSITLKIEFISQA